MRHTGSEKVLHRRECGPQQLQAVGKNRANSPEARSSRPAHEEALVNVYVVLLRRMERRSKPAEHVQLEPAVVGSIAPSSGVQLLDIIACAGIFDAALVCRAPDNRTVARLLDALDGWHTDALLATAHIRYESLPDILPAATKNRTRTRTT